jgi:hypothetical protein
MKRRVLLLVGVLALGGIALSLSGCVTDGVRVSGRFGIHYGPFSFWFYDGPWLDGWPYWGSGIFIAPPPVRIGPPPRWPQIPQQPRIQPRR